MRGASADALDASRKWHFIPTVKNGDNVSQGDIIGGVDETSLIKHRVMVPAGMHGKISGLEDKECTINDVIARIGGEGADKEITLSQRWNVRVHRPVLEKLAPNVPLITGQRVVDSMFPVAKGGTASVPGGFGTGKTVLMHSLSMWSDADIIVYVGCGERGNEMADILTSFPKLKDPKTMKPLMDRTILIANTSNMPVAAREASIYTGITIAEYYRDMGYSVALMADSTSRWAEALREISGRLEEMPGEEGYPAYLGKKIAEFYERAGMSKLLNGKTGSITVVGAVSPAGGDLSEPVSQNTLRATRVFWSLDSLLANSRHFPSVNWLNSYSLYMGDLTGWFEENVGKDWKDLHSKAMGVLQRESEINDIVQLVGYDAVPESDKLVLETARSIREDFLQQDAFDEIDTFTSVHKQYLMLKSILSLGDECTDASKRGITAEQLRWLKARRGISRMRFIKEDKIDGYYDDVMKDIKEVRQAKPEKG